jgi:NTE family protein
MTIIPRNMSFKWIPFLILCLLGSDLSAQNQDQKIGLVLAGGAALGLAHIGVLQYLEEMGIPIDRIGGTSMGGIIGGLYASGFTAYELEQIVLAQDWDHLLGNDLDRQKAPFYAKKNADHRFLISLEQHRTTLTPKEGLVNGINIYQVFQELCFPVRDINDFENLSIPFYCMAVDLNRGEQIILDKGYLPDALLATMSIPGIFSPVVQDSMLLVDGGLLNNFPVQIMREKGADLVIGVTVNGLDTSSYSKGLLDVLGRAYEVVMTQARQDKIPECDICIEVDLPGLTVADFEEAKQLIEHGRSAAKKVETQLKAIPQKFAFYEKTGMHTPEKLLLNQIHINGNQEIEEQFILDFLHLEDQHAYTFNSIQSSIENLQATGLFKGLHYRFSEYQNGTDLFIDLEENNKGAINIGLRYDNDFSAALLFNSTVRNSIWKGDFLNMELKLNRNPYLKAEYLRHSLHSFSPFVQLLFRGDDYFQYSNNRKYTDSQHNLMQYQIGLQWDPKTFIRVKTGVEFQLYGFNENSRQFLFSSLNQQLYNYFIEYESDTYDDYLFPKKGYGTRINAKIISPSIEEFQREVSLWMSASHRAVVPFSKQIFGLATVYFGSANHYVDRQYAFYQGGLDAHHRYNIITQAGLPIMRHNGNHAAGMQMLLRYDHRSNHHFVAGYHISSVSEKFQRLFRQTWNKGIQLGYSYSTPLGPLSINFSSPVSELQIFTYVSAGYSF